MVAVLGCLAPPHSAIYVSAPVTMGPLFARWRVSRPDLRPDSTHYREAHRREVVEPNRLALRAIVDRARLSLGPLVIDPTAVPDIEEWQQGDYHELWAETIKRYVNTLILVSGWQYSLGCAIEFATAVTAEIPILTESFDPLDVTLGSAQLREAVGELSALGLPIEGFIDVLARVAQHG